MGGIIIAVLVSALVVPWFVDWNAFRATFEREAEKILGQPVTVAGTADASLLPMPSLVFTDVRVGGTPGKPMMTVDRFAVRIELIPLISGAFKVVDMAITRPHLQVTVGADGTPDWLRRSEASKTLDPDAVTLEKVDISDGAIDYRDARTGRSVSLTNINAAVDARSLLGPWKIEGGLVADGVPTTFRVATGRRDANNTIRVKLEANPATVPVTLSAEGPLGLDDKGLAWAGNFGLTHVQDDDGKTGRKPPPGWRASGSFDLRPEQLRFPAFTLSQGPEDRPYSLTGAASVDLGKAMRFDAVLKARQLDLDRSIGKGPNEPASVEAASGAVVQALAEFPVPSIPGRIGFDIPGIVIGGSVIQNLRFDAVTAENGWKIEELGADLPGRTRLAADGVVTTAPKATFDGAVRIVSDQPTTFAAWWRGGKIAAMPQLRAFEMNGQLHLAPGSVGISGMTARMQNSDLSGSLRWQQAASAGRRNLAVDLTANRLDYNQLASLTELFAGQRLNNSGALADDFQIKLATDALDVDDITLGQVVADGSLSNGVLVAKKLSIGNVSGAAISASGRVADLTGAPNGQLSVSVDATDLTGSSALVERLLPGSAIARWFKTAAPLLGPAILDTVVNARAQDGVTHANLTVNGTSGGTAIDMAIGFKGTPAAWREGELKVSAAVDSSDAGHLLRQLGYEATPLEKPGRARIAVETADGGGSLARGVNGTIKGEFAGIAYSTEGSLGLDEAGLPSFQGTITAKGADATPALTLVGLALPGQGEKLPLEAASSLDIRDGSATLSFRDARLGEAYAGGMIDFGRDAGRWKLKGDVAVDEADLTFALAVGLGLPPDLLANTESVWSKTTFGRPAVDGFDVAFRLSADRLTVGDGVAVTNAAVETSFSGDRAEIRLTNGDFAGGKASGSLSIVNPQGDATVAGQVSVKGAALPDVVWQRDGRSVADGTVDFSGQFDGSGRSAAGVVSSLSGGGSFAIGEGSARFVNPEAFGAVIRASNAGREIGEAELRKLFAGYLDAGTLAFDRVEGAFSIAAGTLRAPNLNVVSKSATMAGGATIDLNADTIDSQWTLTIDPGEDRVSGAIPQVGLVFSGPLDAPTRRIDVAPLAGFLSVRAFEREVERIEKLQAEILEKEKLNRLARLAREDDQRRSDAARKAEEARQAAEAADKQAAEKAAADAAAAKRAADKAAAEAVAAKKAADAARKAEAQRQERARRAAEAEQRQQLDFTDGIESLLRDVPLAPQNRAAPPPIEPGAPMRLTPPESIPN
ncbi:MAG: AsmA-like C-terminal region-containing protein [Candidatus Kaistia colombiensis]|nr:MAG: AsmA-like C-terminal region-containing protein [Kaistia sp.]